MIVGVGGNIEINRGHGENEIYKCKRLKTRCFQPDDFYVYESLQNPRMKSYIKQGRFKKPVYMITGLKIARGVSAETTERAKGTELTGSWVWTLQQPESLSLGDRKPSGRRRRMKACPSLDLRILSLPSS